MGKWVVCSAWPYVNSVPHLGTLIGSVLSADVYARYLRMKGENIVFVSGSDEHGTPIEVEARKRGIHPKKLTDEMHDYVSRLFKEYGISFDNYTRTESPVHKEFVREFLMKIYKNGYIFTQNIEMTYCPNCKMFLPDRFVVGTCPYCKYPHAKGDQCDACGRLLDPTQLLDPKCVFCNTTPEIRETKHWFFDLPRLSEELEEYVKNHPRFPANVKKFSLNWIREGLKPRALTRDNEWGILAPFPGAEGKTVYVWFDALLGYISATKEYGENIGKPYLWEEYWFDKNSRTIFFIGKDNIPFHAIILPAMLLASGEPYVLPWQVAATEYLMFEWEKFSKSRGIGVWIDEALEILEPDYWRFALIEMRPELRDSNFTWREFYRIVNSDMNDDIGNFIHRILMFVYKNYDSTVPAPSRMEEPDLEFKEKVASACRSVEENLDECRYKLALENIVGIAREGNYYINLKKPWEALARKDGSADTTMWIGVNVVKALAVLLSPITPNASRRIWENLGLEGDVLEYPWRRAGEMDIQPGHKIRSPPKPLFNKLPENFIDNVQSIIDEARRKVLRPAVLA